MAELTVHSLHRMANFFLVAEDGELTLIDAGGHGSLGPLRTKLEELGLEPAAVRRIVVTHSHVDHVGGLAALRRATGAKVLAHEAEAPYLAGRARMPPRPGVVGWLFGRFEPLVQPPPIAVDQTLRDGDTIPGTGIVVVYTPGHTPGHICLHHPATHTLFTGDAIANRGNHLRHSPAFFATDPARARQSVQKLVPLEAENIYFAHGATLRGAPKDALRALG